MSLKTQEPLKNYWLQAIIDIKNNEFPWNGFIPSSKDDQPDLMSESARGHGIIQTPEERDEIVVRLLNQNP